MNNPAEKERGTCEWRGEGFMNGRSIWHEGAPCHFSLQISFSQPPSQCLAKNSSLDLSHSRGCFFMKKGVMDAKCLGGNPAQGLVGKLLLWRVYCPRGTNPRGLQCQKSCCHWKACTPPCWLSFVVLHRITELWYGHQSAPSTAQQHKAEHFHSTKASLTPHRWTSWVQLAKCPSCICTDAHSGFQQASYA